MKAKVPVLWQLMTWLQLELEQLERLRSEDTPRRPV